jgi:CubicO group peptidase (beta-lactamase class C family)
MKKRILILLAVGGVGWGYYKIAPVARMGAGYAAKVACSAVFVSGRDLESVKRDELGRDHPLARMQTLSVDAEGRAVNASITPLFERRAIYRPGLGCTLLSSVSEAELRAQGSGPSPSSEETVAEMPWPEGEGIARPPADRNRRLAEVMAWAFAEPDAAHPRRTRAVVVVRDGQLVAERYAAGFPARMPLQGWSMAKSITNALVGILVREGRLRLDAPAPVEEWRQDERRHITINHLMQMSSGLAFAEEYGGLLSDVTRMLFLEPGAGRYAATLPLASKPGTAWAYSSGTTNILSRIIREAVGGSLSDYWAFPRKQLFDRIGARSVVLEPDATGVFVGSSFDYATARDWARLGLLYLNDGVWNGERILPEGWVRYSVTPAPAAHDGNYGAQIWLNAGRDGKRPFPRVPADMYYFSGFEGQTVAVIPSRRLVAVRLGVSQTPEAWNLGEFLERLISALGEG